MATISLRLQPIFTTLIVLILAANQRCHAAGHDRKGCIVFLDKVEHPSRAYILNILRKVLHGSYTPEQSLIYSYRTINAFAARLTTQEAAKLTRVPGVLSVLRSRKYQLQDGSSDEVLAPSESAPEIEDGKIHI